MKKFSTCFSIVFVSAIMLMSHDLSSQTCSKVCTPPAIDTASLLGDWSGSCTYEGKTYDLKLNFRLQEGQLVANASVPDLGLNNKNYTTWVCRSNEVHMKLNLPSGKVVKFIGKPQDEAFSGRFHYTEANVCSAASDSFSVRRTGV